jgi:hypothetical protein
LPQSRSGLTKLDEPVGTDPAADRPVLSLEEGVLLVAEDQVWSLPNNTEELEGSAHEAFRIPSVFALIVGCTENPKVDVVMVGYARNPDLSSIPDKLGDIVILPGQFEYRLPKILETICRALAILIVWIRTLAQRVWTAIARARSSLRRRGRIAGTARASLTRSRIGQRYASAILAPGGRCALHVPRC